jgi:hypothetical protein
MLLTAAGGVFPGGLPKVELTYPTEPDYGSEVVLGSSIEYAPYAMTLSDVTVGQFAVSKPNKEAIMKIFKFLDKDGSGSLDFSDFEQVRSTRSGEWLQELAKMDTNGTLMGVLPQKPARRHG